MDVVATETVTLEPKRDCFPLLMPIRWLLALLAVTFVTCSYAARTLDVGDRSVSYWPAEQGPYLAEFQFKLKGYKNTYALDCVNREFLWTGNVKTSTGEVTNNSSGAKWRPLNAESTTANAVFKATCRQLLTVNTKAATNWVGLRYAELCRSSAPRAADIPCPYREDATCRGEGCFVSGVAELTKPVSLFVDPGSNQQVHIAKPGEFLVLETSVTYSVPCPAHVQNSHVSALRSGMTVYRLSYAGEGTSRYLAEGRVLGSAVEDNIPLLSECPQRDEQWVRLRSETGRTGWALLDYKAFLGMSIHDPFSRNPPAWTKNLASGAEETKKLAASPNAAEATAQSATVATLPETALPGTHANSTAVLSDPSAEPLAQTTDATPAGILDRFPGVRDTIDGLSYGSAADKAATTEGLQMALMFLVEMESDGIAADLGLSADDFAAEFVINPDATLGLVGYDILKGAGEALIAEAASKMVAGYMFAAGPLSKLPDAWQVPLRACVKATVDEGAGLIMTGTSPTPAALVGPIVNRLSDVHEIYKATNALSETQAAGLYGVAIGAEINAELAVKYPGNKTSELIKDWFQLTRGNLRDIVGLDDVDEVHAIATMGYKALLAQQQGDHDTARQEVARMTDAGEAGQGPTPLSAEGPIDLLIKLASGGDAPRLMAQTFMSATRLRELSAAEATLASGTGDDAGTAASTDPWRGRSDIAAALSEVVAAYPVSRLDGCAAAHGPLAPEFRRRLLQGTALTVVGQRGKRSTVNVTKQMLDSDRFCIDGRVTCAAYNLQLYFCTSGQALFVNAWRKSVHYQITDVTPAPKPAAATGKVSAPIYGPNIPVEGRDCTISSGWSKATSVRWSGRCENGRATGAGTLKWLKGHEVIRRTRVGPQWGMEMSNGILRFDLDIDVFAFEMGQCDGTYRSVNVTAPAETPSVYFENTWIVEQLTSRAADVVRSLCPVPRKSLSNISVSIELAGGEQVVRARNYDQNALTWREFKNKAVEAMKRELTAAERNRVAMEHQRAAQARAGALEREFEARRTGIVQRAESFIATGKGTTDDLAAALEVDQIRALRRLEEGVTLRLAAVSGIESMTHDGKRHYRAGYSMPSPFARLEKEFRSKQDFSWENWMAQTQAGQPRRTEVSCLFAKVSQLPQAAREVSGELLAFSSGSKFVTISLLCD